MRSLSCWPALAVLLFWFALRSTTVPTSDARMRKMRNIRLPYGSPYAGTDARDLAPPFQSVLTCGSGSELHRRGQRNPLAKEPIAADRAMSGNLVAVASCRDGSDWLTSIVTFTGSLSEKQTSALIIVILSPSAEAALSKAELDIRRANRKPPLVSTKALVTAFDLTSDYMVYKVQSSGEISPADAEGKLRFAQKTRVAHQS